MCNHACVQGNKTNHSLRAAGVTQMYDSGVPEKLIQERSGHRSLEVLRTYERTNQKQHRAVSALLSAPVGTFVAENYSIKMRLTHSVTIPLKPSSFISKSTWLHNKHQYNTYYFTH
jgi:hypothetical protein